jgi:hypothetical protein
VASRIRREGIEHPNEAMERDPHEWEAIRGSRPEPSLRAWVEKHNPGLTEKVVMTRTLPAHCMSQKTGQKIFQMRWQVISFSAGRRDLLTCDSPVMLTHGLDDPNCWLMLPLGPNLLFLANHVGALKVVDPDRIIRDVNRELVRVAERRVCATGPHHLALIKKYLNNSN